MSSKERRSTTSSLRPRTVLPTPQKQRNQSNSTETHVSTQISQSQSLSLHRKNPKFNLLPQLAQREDKETLQKLKTSFRDCIDSLTDLLQHNSSVIRIREKLQNDIVELERSFNIFFNQINKSSGSSFSISKVQASPIAPMLKNSAIPFIKSWGVFVQHVSDLKSKGVDYIGDSIDNNFNLVLTILENVQKGIGYNAGVHDPVTKKSKKLQQRIWTFQGQIAKFLGKSSAEREKDVEQLVLDLKSFSRDVSSAFSADFSSIAQVSPDNEKNRNNSYNNICDVIFAVQGSVSFESDVKKVTQFIDELQPTIEIIAQNLEIFQYLRAAEKEESDDESEKKAAQKKTSRSMLSSFSTPNKKSARAVSSQANRKKQTPILKRESDDDGDDKFFSRDLDINELMERGFIVFKRSGLAIENVKEFFETLRYKISQLKKEIENNQYEIYQINQQLQYANTYKDRLTQESNKVMTMKNSLNQIVEKNNELTQELQEMRESSNIVGLRKCLRECNTKLRTLMHDLSIVKVQETIQVSPLILAKQNQNTQSNEGLHLQLSREKLHTISNTQQYFKPKDLDIENKGVETILDEQMEQVPEQVQNSEQVPKQNEEQQAGEEESEENKEEKKEQNPFEKQFLNDKELIQDTEELINDNEHYKCKQCAASEQIFAKLEKQLGSRLFIEEIQLLQKNNMQLQKQHDKMKSEKDALIKEKTNLSNAIKKILEFFNVAPPTMVALDSFSVQSVQEQLALMNNKFDVETNKFTVELDNISNQLKSLLKVQKNLPIEAMLEQIKKTQNDQQNEIDEMNSFLSDVERRLCRYLNVEKSGRPICESIKMLISEMEVKGNPLQRTIADVTHSLRDAEKTLSRVMKTKLSDQIEQQTLEERMANLVQNIHSLE